MAIELTYLQDWYSEHCDGDWEHEDRVRINSLDNPGWHLWVNIEDTELSGKLIEWTKYDSSENDWIHYRSDGRVFEAACGPQNLGQALAFFRSFAETYI